LLKDNKKVDIPQYELEKLVSALDLNESGYIDYTEFLAAFAVNEVYKQEGYLKDVFMRLDKVLTNANS